jgi:hypothetical protein
MKICSRSRPAEGQEGHFRLVLAGAHHMQVNVPLKDVLPIKEMAAFELHGQFLPGHQIQLQRNSTCSAWVDMEDLIRAQDVDVFDADRASGHETLLAYMEEARLAQTYMGKETNFD